MKLNAGNLLLPIVALMLAGVSACKKDVEDPGPPPPPSPNSKLTFTFSHNVSGAQIIPDSIMFTNLAGNEYSVAKLRYLISDIRLDDLDGNFRELDEYHLVDISDESTLTFSPSDSIKKGKYKAINYYIGFLESENVNSGDYGDLDAANWAFPPSIDKVPAGGYYALQMSGRYYGLGDTVPSSYEINIGSLKKVNNSSGATYKPNPIIGSLDAKELQVETPQVEIELRFNVARLFSKPGGTDQLDLNLYDNDFESNQEATELVSSNAAQVLSLGNILYGPQAQK